MSDTAKAHLKQIYNDIISTPPRYGVYHKTIFHIHTPESHDFELVDEWNYRQYQSASFDDVMEKCVKQRVFPDGFDFSSINPKTWNETYSSKKEWLSFVMVADALIKEQYAFVVVTDHNTIAGIEKLKKAVKAVHSAHKDSVYPAIIAGVEISCADKLHVVVIFNMQKHKEIVKDWLDVNLIGPEDGSYQTSLHVIEFFSAKGCLAYIAHINTSNIFGEKYLSGAYKVKLFTNKNLNFFGLNKKEEMTSVASSLSNFKIKNPCFLLDNDAHNISKLSNNYFWIKGSKPTYDTLIEALNDYTVSVCFEEERPKQYIDGIFIESGGFLVGAKDSPTSNTIIRFSPGLNCFIGGRGTGKSTVLQMIDYVLSQRVDSENVLEFLCEHGNTYILYHNNGVKYLIEMIMPIKGEGERILKCFGQNEAGRYGFRYQFNPSEVRGYARQKLLTVYEISRVESDISFIKVDKRAVMDTLYDTRYSVNKLVSTASGNEIQNFIFDLIFKNKNLTDIVGLINVRSLSGLRRIIKGFPELEQRRAEEIQNELRPFNAEQRGILQIEYSQNAPVASPNISDWIFGGENPQGYFAVKGKKYNISKADVVEYVLYVLSKENIIDFLTMVFEDSMVGKRYAYPVLHFSEPFAQKHVDAEINEITDENQANIIDEIYRLLSRTRNVTAIIDYLKSATQHKEQFSLYFNVNSSTTSNGAVNYKDVRKLSLGQKVVAMLDLIFAYGKYVNDYRPIIIDQPEDNLDSQYIYKNLVSQLRAIKKNRQVIIATHNATIVTNAMADQVCVMNSDGSHGWVERSGYPSEKAIKNSILNYLEGGKDSFKHKQQIYHLVLNE